MQSAVERLLKIGFRVNFSRRPKGPFIYVDPEDYSVIRRPACERLPSDQFSYVIDGQPSCHAYWNCPLPATKKASKYCAFHQKQLMQAWQMPQLTTDSLSDFEAVEYRLPDPTARNSTKVRSLLRTVIQAADAGHLWATDCEAYMGVAFPHAIAPWELAVENATTGQSFSSTVENAQRLDHIGASLAACSIGTLNKNVISAARRICGKDAIDTSTGRSL